MNMLLDFDPTDDQAGFKILEHLTSDAGRLQEEVLKEIVSQNANTQYLRDHHFNFDIHHHKQAFKAKVPVVSYEDIKPIIERIANGEPSHIISSQPITELLTSSGTSGGQPKMMPSTAQELNRKTFFYNLLIPVINKYISGLDKGKAMYLLFTKPEMTTPSGLKARPVLTSYYHSSHFKNRPFNPYNVYTSPDATILCSDSKQSMFCQLLCGLVHRYDVLRVGAVFASALLRAIKFLEDHHQEFISNIRSGQLSDWVTDHGCRKAVASDALTRPDPDAAAAIEAECGNGYSWEGIIKRLWPRTKYVEVIVTGSMAQYIPMLEFYCGGLPLVSTMYGSSECYFGINLRPLSKPRDVSYTLLPNMAYFEFIPVDKDRVILDGCGNNQHHAYADDHDPVIDRLETQTVDLVDVKIGRYYELVVTTYTGLYRYKVGDILKVAGFYNNAPEFQFVQRRNVVLSIDTDKTNEEDLLNAVAKAKLIVEPLGFLLAEYTAYADTSSVPGHYVLFWELIQLVNCNHEKKGPGPGLAAIEASVMEKCCATIEESLDSIYRRCRKKDGSIGPLEIRVVGKGGFDALMDYCLSQGSSVNQYKTPRCIKSEEAIRILDSRIVGSFFSRDAPSWEPKFNYLN